MGEMVIMNDLEWPMLSYYVIYYEKFKKVIQRIEKEALITTLGDILPFSTYILLRYCVDDPPKLWGCHPLHFFTITMQKQM